MQTIFNLVSQVCCLPDEKGKGKRKGGEGRQKRGVWKGGKKEMMRRWEIESKG